MSEAASSPPIPLSDPAARQAAARRRLQVLQAFVKRKPTIATTTTTTNNDCSGRNVEENKKEMRWSPFVAFSRKVVALQEMNASSSSDNEEEGGDVRLEEKQEKNEEQGSGQQPVNHQQAATKKKNKEIFEEAVYSLMEGGGKEEGADESLSSQIVSIAARRLLINGVGPSSSLPPTPLVSLLERREAAGTSIGDVQASTRDGIDNTGNFHWPTEDITAAYFINKLVDSEETAEYTGASRTVLCELGAGCGLASFAITKALSVLNKSRPLQRHLIVATDGNSRVVHTLKRNAKRVTCTISGAASSSSTNNNIEGDIGDQEHINNPTLVLCSKEVDRTSTISVSAAKLPWQCETSLQHIFSTVDTWLDSSATTSPPSTKRNNSVVLFGSDCLFFERFHHSLANLVIKWIYHYAQMDGTEVQVLLFAPSRDGSLERFTDILNDEIINYKKKRAQVGVGSCEKSLPSTTTVPGISIDVTVQSDYDECVTRVWKGIAIKDKRFNPDRHLPKLVSITSTSTTNAATV